MANLVVINPEPYFNPNLYPNAKMRFSSFTGGGTANINGFSANGFDSILMNLTTSTALVVNINENITVDTNGLYCISFSVSKTDILNRNINLALKVFKNSILTDTFPINLKNSESGFIDQNWNRLSQNVVLNSGQNITFQIEAQTSEALNTDIYISAFKVEYINKIFNSPSVYSYPNSFIINENNITGWAQYVDNLRTTTSPLVITDTVNFTTIPCNGATKDETQLPVGFTEMFNTTTNKLIAKNVNDKFLLNVRFKARTSAANSSFTIGVDIGAANLISPEDRSFSVGANTQQEFSYLTTYFTRETFIANGGLIKIRPRSGTLSIYDISVIPELTHKSR